VRESKRLKGCVVPLCAPFLLERPMFNYPIQYLGRVMQWLFGRSFPLAKRKTRAAIKSSTTRHWPSPRRLARLARVRIALLGGRPLGRGEHKMPPQLQDIQIETLAFDRHEHLLQSDACRSAVSQRYLALPALTRAILYLSQREGMDGAQISLHLGLSRYAVRRHLRRAVAALAKP